MANGVACRREGAAAGGVVSTMAVGITQRELAVANAEFAFTWSDFRQIAELVHAGAGIVLGDAKVNLVYSRLAKRLRAIGLRSFREYCEYVASVEGLDERQAMIAAMTTNVTRFFREPHHFDYLSRKLLPGIAEKALSGGRVRIWSAGCSSGQEAYSIALTVLQAISDADRRDILILATDIDPEMLSRGRNAVYPIREAREIPAELRAKWTTTDGRGSDATFSLSPEARAIVRFKELNLLGPWPMQGRFDLIFCRNVMIYFNENTQNAIWSRFASALSLSGHLCIGHSERIATDRQPFELIAQTTYRLRQGEMPCPRSAS